MQTLNLGDSAYMLLRPKVSEFDSSVSLEKIYRSQEQQHRFNNPFQCGMRYQLPYNAFDTQHRVFHNDIIIMGTDGVFDNLYEEQIIKKCIFPNLDAQGYLKNPQKVASSISKLAIEVSQCNQTETPYTQKSVASGKDREEQLGGKQDDITVIVG